MRIIVKCSTIFMVLLLAIVIVSCGRSEGAKITPSVPAVSNPTPEDGATVISGVGGQFLQVYAPGATSGTFYYDDDATIDNSVAATVNGNYLQVTIPYTSGEMTNNGTNYWHVEATNTAGTSRYPASGNLSFTVAPYTTFAPSTWVIIYDWSCNGPDGTTNWYLNSNNTFVSSESGTGTWSLFGSTLTVSYSTSNAVYTGTVSGTSMSGTMTANTLAGCWTATHQSNTIPKPSLENIYSAPAGINAEGVITN